MSGTNVTGQVLGASTSVIGGASILPITGGSVLGFVLPLVAVVCGVVILSSLALTNYLENKAQ